MLLGVFQQLDIDRHSDSEEMQVSSMDSLLEISEIVSLIFTLTFSTVIIKLTSLLWKLLSSLLFVSKMQLWKLDEILAGKVSRMVHRPKTL